MIAPLRRRHRATVLAVALVLPAPLWLALANRAEPPRDEAAWAADLGAPARDGTRTLRMEEDPVPVEVRVGGAGPDSSLQVLPLRPPIAPDLLVYASERSGSTSAALPADARFLGTLRSLATPQGIALEQGDVLLFFSVAHGAVVAGLPLTP